MHETETKGEGTDILDEVKLDDLTFKRGAGVNVDHLLDSVLLPLSLLLNAVQAGIVWFPFAQPHFTHIFASSVCEVTDAEAAEAIQ